jgi:hypothetical protein
VSIGLAAVAGCALVVALAATLGASSGGLGLATRAVGLLSFVPMYFLQREPDRVYHFYRQDPDQYASLWIPGILAVVVLGMVQAGLLIAVVGEPS